MMQDWAIWALETAKRRGASYADARVMHIRSREISTKNGQVGALLESESLGIGVRVIAAGAWGFSATDRLTREGVQACAAEAVTIAKASALAKRGNVLLVPEAAYVDTWQNPFIKDPFRIPVERQIGVLLAADKEMRRVKGVTVAEGSMSFRRIEELFASTAGSLIHQPRRCTRVLESWPRASPEVKFRSRSYPNSFGVASTCSRAMNWVESLDLAAHAPRVAEEAVALHSAAQCPEGQRTIILDSSQLGLQIHESVGHPMELDRVLGMEANFAGMSFLTTDKLHKLKYGSEIVNVVADARLEHGPGLGTFAYDDEGVPAQCTRIITEGLFTGYLTSRDTAAAIGDKRSNGTMRSESWNRLPIIRMTNISLNPGAWKYEDLIADTPDAIPNGDQSLLVHRRPPLPFSVFHRDRLGDQEWQESAHVEKSQLQRDHYRILE